MCEPKFYDRATPYHCRRGQDRNMSNLYITTEQFFASEGLNWHNPDLRETFNLAEEDRYGEAP